MQQLYYLGDLSVTEYDKIHRYDKTAPLDWCQYHWCYKDHAHEPEYSWRPGQTNYGTGYIGMLVIAVIIIVIHYVVLVDFLSYIVSKMKNHV